MIEHIKQAGAYRVLRRIGEGGKGSVLLAEYAMFHRRVALKLLHSESSNKLGTNAKVVKRLPIIPKKLAFCNLILRS